jgi:hypothetical protein
MGIICGLSVQGIALIAVNVCTDWDREVSIFSASSTISIIIFLLPIITIIKDDSDEQRVSKY